MPPTIDQIERDIARERAALNAWLAEAYAGREDRRYYGELDACYERWADVETLAGSVFDLGVTQLLGESSIDSLLFFISRNDERARIIAWLSSTTGIPFSWCGNLSYSDLLYLSEQALIRDDDDCDYQLVMSFQKCESLDDRAIDVLDRFFQKRDSYTRRMVLLAFSHFRLPHAVDLATRLWRSDHCEFAKLSCLHALKSFPEARPLFDACLQEYRNSYDVEAEDYRRSHIERLTSADVA